MARTIYAVVNTDPADSVGALEWRETQDELPVFGEGDQRFVVTIPDSGDSLTRDEITEELDALLGGYDLPETWECGPIS